MKISLKLAYLLCILFCFSLTITLNSLASVDLPWSTTFNCSDWEQGQSLDCDGLSQYGGWTCTGGMTSKIIDDANNYNGEGSKGARFYIGDGVDNNSACLAISFNSNQPEIWVRWYMRYEQGFTFSSLQYDKILYFDVGTSRIAIPEFYGSDKLNIATAAGGNNVSYDGTGWNTINGGSTSDGQWHCYEIHMKMDTNGSNGVAQWWIDGELKMDRSDINYGTHTGWTRFHFASNQRYPNNGGCKAVDFDDIAISKIGYIGPIDGSGISPSIPRNLEAE